jgi:hypothetical protein
VHAIILQVLREAADPLLTSLLDRPDEQIIHRMFSNHRGERGVRLTKFGNEIMRHYFRSYEIRLPQDEEIKPRHLIFLDEHMALPYFLDTQCIVVFDDELGVKLRLVDGRLSILVNIELD